MSGGGGQWNHFYGKSSRFINFPLVRKFGTQNIIPSLISAGQNTKTDTDPLVRARPTSPKEQDKPHETDHIITSIALQSGSGSTEKETPEEAVTTKVTVDSESLSSIESDVDNDELEEDAIHVSCLDLEASEEGDRRSSNTSAVKRKNTNPKPTPKPTPSKKFKFNIL